MKKINLLTAVSGGVSTSSWLGYSLVELCGTFVIAGALNGLAKEITQGDGAGKAAMSACMGIYLLCKSHDMRNYYYGLDAQAEKKSAIALSESSDRVHVMIQA